MSAKPKRMTGMPVHAAQELFDVAVVSSGPLTDGCPTAAVPCGRLYVVDVSSLTDLASFHHDLRVISQIPLPGRPSVSRWTLTLSWRTSRFGIGIDDCRSQPPLRRAQAT